MFFGFWKICSWRRWKRRLASLSAGQPAGLPASQPISLFQMDIPFSNGHVHLKKGCPFEKGNWQPHHPNQAGGLHLIQAGRLDDRQTGWLAGRPAGWPAGRPKNINIYMFFYVFFCVPAPFSNGHRLAGRPAGWPAGRPKNINIYMFFLCFFRCAGAFFKWTSLFQMDMSIWKRDIHLKKAYPFEKAKQQKHLSNSSVFKHFFVRPPWKWNFPFSNAHSLFQMDTSNSK